MCSNSNLVRVTSVTAYVVAMSFLPCVPSRAQVGGGGTTNYVPIWTSSTTLGNSAVFQSVNKLQNSIRFINPSPGDDIGQLINAAVMDLESSSSNCPGGCGGIVFIPAGHWTLTTTVTISETGIGNMQTGINIGIEGAGSEATEITSTVVNGPAFQIMGTGIDGLSQLQEGFMARLSVLGNSSSSASGVEIGNVAGFRFSDVAVENFTGAGTPQNGGGDCFWFNNSLNSGTFTERTVLDHVTTNNCMKGMDFAVNGGGNSFAYTHMLSVHMSVGQSQSGIQVETGASLYGVQLRLSANCSGTLINVAGGGSISESSIDVTAEAPQGVGAQLLNVASGGVFTVSGFLRGEYMGSTVQSGSYVIITPVGIHDTFGGSSLGSYNSDVMQTFATTDSNPISRPYVVAAVGQNVNFPNTGDFLVLFNAAGAFRILNNGTFADATQVAYIDNQGNAHFNGTLTKGAGSFKIDDPVDPANKYLYHSFVESPDMMNIYNGNVTTDQRGLATVLLPDYFEALNREFRYQLTTIGQFAQAIVVNEIKDNRFTIQTDKPAVKVSWQVTGIRHDAYANAHRIRVEEEKPDGERGHYLHPELFPRSKCRKTRNATKNGGNLLKTSVRDFEGCQ